MDEYIKRKDAKKAILDACGCDCRCMAETECNGMCDIHAGSVWGAVDNIPAADVRENVRGEWIRYSTLWTCSECKKDIRTTTDGIENFDENPGFCPYCGADMRGEVK